jgi:hypothetical protein
MDIDYGGCTLREYERHVNLTEPLEESQINSVWEEKSEFKTKR